MNLPFMTRTRTRAPRVLADLVTPKPSAHMVESGYGAGRCRFTLDCSCGAHFDTPYIDEALEWRELHETLAPLSDQLPR